MPNTLKNKSQGGSGNQEWKTPKWFLDILYELFGHYFQLDPCCSGPEDKCGIQFYTPTQNGLKRGWYDNVFVNPPWNDIPSWVAKAKTELANCKSITFLIPNKPETGWFKELWSLAPEVYIVRPRLNYFNPKTRKIVSGIAFTSLVVRLEPKWVGSSMPPRVFLLEAKRPRGAER